MRKKITVLLLIATILCGCAVVFGACSAKKDYVVAIVDDSPHFSTTMAHKGFINRLDALMKEAGKSVGYKYSKSYGIESIPKEEGKTPAQVKTEKEAENVKNFVDKKVDLFLALSQSSADAVEAGAGDIPAIFTSVGIAAQTLDGDSVRVQIEKQVDVMQMISKKSEKFGILYYEESIEENKVNSVGFTNAKLQADIAKSVMELRGIQVKVGTYRKDSYETRTDDNLIKSILEDFQNDGVDCVFIPADNTIANVSISSKVFSKSNAQTKLPIVCGDVSMNSSCGVATYGVDYYAMGVKAAEIAFDILVNGNKREGLTRLETDFSAGVYCVNQKAADAWGITVADDLKQLL